MPPPRPSPALPPDARPAVSPGKVPAAALAALLLAGCGYPDAALAPPTRATQAPAQAPVQVTAAGAARPPGDFRLGTPFVVIRFGPETAGPETAGYEPADYEPALAGAVAEALAQRPDVKFHLLAVTAGDGPHLLREPSLSHAEAVLRSLAALGVAPDEVFVAAAAGPAGTVDEVRLYLR